MGLLKEKRKLRADDAHGVKELVSRLCAGEEPRPWPELGRLDESEATQLVEIVEAINRGEAEPDARFWRLVAIASGFAPDHFAKRAAEAKAARKAAERAAKERRLGLSQREESNFFRAAAEALYDEEVWIDDVATLVVVLCQFAGGKGFNRGVSYFTGSGRDAALVIDWNRGGVLGPVDGQGALMNVESRLHYLHEQGWIRLSGRGPVREIRLGERLLDVLDAVPVGEQS